MSDQPKYSLADAVDSSVAITIGGRSSVIDRLPTCEEPTVVAKVIHQKPNTIKKEDKVRASRDFHDYFGELLRGSQIDEIGMRTYISVGLERCRSTVTTHLLYAADIKGMNRPDIFEAAIPYLIECKPGYVFFQTLIRGLVRLDAWKLICMFIRDDVSSKVKQFAFETLATHIKRHNRRCLRALPRQGRIANRLRGYLKMKPAKWRHVLSGGSRGSIYSFMSSNDWQKIEYKFLNAHTISANYRAFMRHDKDRFSAYLISNPDVAAIVKRIHYHNKPYYLSQKEIYDKYVVPMKETQACQSTNQPSTI